jgi:hypothetical protein
MYLFNEIKKYHYLQKIDWIIRMVLRTYFDPVIASDLTSFDLKTTNLTGITIWGTISAENEQVCSLVCVQWQKLDYR